MWTARITLNMSFWLPKELLDEMAAEASKWSPLETGGVLMGYISDLNEVAVTAIVHAGPAARRTRTSFLPDPQFRTTASLEDTKHQADKITTLAIGTPIQEDRLG
jgi:hypothetical protein